MFLDIICKVWVFLPLQKDILMLNEITTYIDLQLIEQIDWHFILLIIFFYAVTVQLIYQWVVFSRIGFYRRKKPSNLPNPVSVVIYSRNEAHHLRTNIPIWMEQDFHDYEILIINDNSDDDTEELLKTFSGIYPNLKIINLGQNLNFFTGNKFAIAIGIKSAKHDIVLFTYAHCLPSGKQWIRNFQSHFTPGKEIVLGHTQFIGKKRSGNLLARYDLFEMSLRYLSFAKAGMPYMGVGSNLAYRKSLFYSEGGFIPHYNINTGEDDLFINRAAKKRNTDIEIHPESLANSSRKLNTRLWLHLKYKQQHTYRHYRYIHRLVLGHYHFSRFIFWIIFAYLAMVFYMWPFLFGAFFLRVASQLIIYKGALKRLNDKNLWLLSPFLEIILLVINPFIKFSGYFVHKKEWY